MKKIVPIFLLAILMASFAGFGYSLWFEELTLTGYIDTTYMDVEWSTHCTYDNETKPLSSIYWAGRDTTNPNIQYLKIDEAYPCVLYSAIFDIKSVGPLPVHIHDMVLTIYDAAGVVIPEDEFDGTIEIGLIPGFAPEEDAQARLGTDSYLEWNFGDGWLSAWCVDLDTTIYVPGTYDAELFCTYQFGLPYPVPELGECQWGMINWIVNNWKDYTSKPAVTQDVIWYIFGEIPGPLTGDALKLYNAAVKDGCCFIPNCDMGEVAAVLVYAGMNPTPSPPGVPEPYQWTIVEMCCQCVEYEPTVATEIQLHQGDSAWFCLKVHLNNDAVQDFDADLGPEYTFTITSLVHQYNEEPAP